MWIWRRLEISWRDKITNDEVLKRVDEERSLPNKIWQRKHRWKGHVLRHDRFLQGIFEGKMLGKRTRGRRRMQMLHDLIVNSDYVTSSKQLQKGWCGDTVEGYPEPALQQKTEEREEREMLLFFFQLSTIEQLFDISLLFVTRRVNSSSASLFWEV